MNMNKKIICLFALLAVFGLVFSPAVFSQVPSGQTAGGVAQQEKSIAVERQLQKKIETPRPKPEGEIEEEAIPEDKGPKVLIKKIKVEGVTLLPQKQVDSVVSGFEGKELSMSAMQKVADLVTDEYRKNGYVTSRAYLPPQTVEKGTLLIRVVEGKLGKLEIQGNRFFKTSLLKKKINIPAGSSFNYSSLQKSLTYINEHPDRTAKAVLSPGEAPGTTDILVDVKDRLPIHAGIEYDNYGSRYIGRNRGTLFIEDNNLLGFDDRAYIRLQRTESSHLKMMTGGYIFPLGNTIKLGAYGFQSKTRLGKEFEDLDARGKANIWGLFYNQDLVDTENVDIAFHAGFDYKNIKNYLLGEENSEDDLRIFKAGVDFDVSDKWGRTIITSELDAGLPNFWGSMSSHDSHSSRSGYGGKFFKGVFNIFRLQPMPFSSDILFKNTAQFTNDVLVASEQFQIGGATSVRGYSPAEQVGDKGIYSSVEWSFPPYFVPKSLGLPLTKEKVYDTVRIVGFFDWATAHSNKTLAGEKKHQTLKGAGVGVRLNVKDNVSFRIEFGYPIGKTPSDGKNVRPWIETVIKF
jgi:hemolysin activation/secretion protein